MIENIYAVPKIQLFDETKLFVLSSSGRHVVTKRDADWGNRCYICNAEAFYIINKKMTCQPKIPICRYHNQLKRRLNWVMWGFNITLYPNTGPIALVINMDVFDTGYFHSS